MGYYRDFARTGEVFVQNPLNDRYPELIYKTGDIGRYNECGELVFVTRKDHQVKHMGHRIELGEIEAAVLALDGIQGACCVYDRERGKLVLFYAGGPEKSAVAAHLKGRLPRYMLPNRVEKLERLPRTPNGKTDRKALAASLSGASADSTSAAGT